MGGVADVVDRCTHETVAKLKQIKTTGMLFVGIVDITDEVEGGEVIVPFTPIHGVKSDQITAFEPSGGTPLFDTVTTALVALRLLAIMARRKRIQLTTMAYILSDGGEISSTVFQQDDVKKTVIMAATAKGRVSGVGIGYSMTEDFVAMGIDPAAIRDIDAEEADLEALFTEMSNSVTATSQGRDAGGF